MSRERIDILEGFIKDEGESAFVLYSLGMEHASLGEVDAGEEYFRRLLEVDPGHVPGYQQYAKLLAKDGRYGKAREILKAGIKHAREKALYHARDMMEELIKELPGNDKGNGGGENKTF